MSQENSAKKPDDHAKPVHSSHLPEGSNVVGGEKLEDRRIEKRQRVRDCMDNLLVLNKIQGSLLSQMNKEID